jgi:hypothetical protein
VGGRTEGGGLETGKGDSCGGGGDDVDGGALMLPQTPCTTSILF